MPAARQASRSSAIALAVMATIQRPVVRPARPDPAGRLEAVELGHLDVHQDQVVASPLERGDRLEAVAGDVGRVAHLLEQPERELLVHRVVLGEQDPQRMALAERRRRGPSSPAARGRDRRRSRRRATVMSASWSADGLTGLVRKRVDGVAGPVDARPTDERG